MAMCPKCDGDMGQTEAVCPHCGYDFPEPTSQYSLAGWWAIFTLFGLWSLTFGLDIGEQHSSPGLGLLIGGAIGAAVILPLATLLRGTRTPLSCFGGVVIFVFLWAAISIGYMIHGNTGAYLGNLIATVFSVIAWSVAGKLTSNKYSSNSQPLKDRTE